MSLITVQKTEVFFLLITFLKLLCRRFASFFKSTFQKCLNLFGSNSIWSVKFAANTQLARYLARLNNNRLQFIDKHFKVFGLVKCVVVMVEKMKKMLDRHITSHKPLVDA